MRRIRISTNPAFLATAGRYLLARGTEKAGAKIKKKLEKKKLYQRYLKVKDAYKDFDDFKKQLARKEEEKRKKAEEEARKREAPAKEEKPEEKPEPVANARRRMNMKAYKFANEMRRRNGMRGLRNPIDREQRLLNRIEEYMDAIGDTDGDNWYRETYENIHDGFYELVRDKNRDEFWFRRAYDLKGFAYYQMTRILQRYGTSYEEWLEEREDW